MSYNDTYTLTFGERAENHPGMQILGKKRKKGFTTDELVVVQSKFSKLGCKCEFVRLNEYLPEEIEAEQAAVLIIRNGVELLLGEGEHIKLLEEQRGLEYDKKTYMYGKVMNSKARWNLCFGDNSQEADLEAKKGTVIAFSQVPHTFRIREKIAEYFGEKANNLYGEGNCYFDSPNCGINYHTDHERNIVIAVRLGATLPIFYQWVRRNDSGKEEYIGRVAKLPINGGDIYAMSEVASGNKKQKVFLKHAAGGRNYIKEPAEGTSDIRNYFKK